MQHNSQLTENDSHQGGVGDEAGDGQAGVDHREDDLEGGAQDLVLLRGQAVTAQVQTQDVIKRVEKHQVRLC